MAKVLVEGNEIDLPDDICKADESLKNALLPFYPAVSNASIKRKTEGGVLTITVTKKAGSKGITDPILRALDAAPETISSILLLEAQGCERAKAMQIDEAVFQMFRDEAEVKRITAALDHTSAQNANEVPPGF